MKQPLPAFVEKIIKGKKPENTVIKISCYDDDHLKDLIELLKRHDNPYITTLILTNGHISNIGIQHFADIPKRITTVNLERNCLNDGVAPLLMEVFKHVEYLDISNNNISRQDAEYLAIHTSQLCLQVVGNRNLTRDDMLNIYVRTAENRGEQPQVEMNVDSEIDYAFQLSKCVRLRAIASEGQNTTNGTSTVLEKNSESSYFECSVD